MKIKITFFAIALMVGLCSCSTNRSKKGDADLYHLAYKHAYGLNITQLIDELLLLTDNDTTKICYSLIMPKTTLKRLSEIETCPLDYTLEKTRNLLVCYYCNGTNYLDSISKDKYEQKDWLINNSINEPLNPIWETICE